MQALSYMEINYRTITCLIDFIRFTGELIIITGLILLQGGVLAGVTQGLFSSA